MLSGGYGNQVILSCRNGYSTDGYRRNGYSGSVPLEKVASHFKGTWQPTELEVCLGEDATEAKTTLKWMSRNAAASLERLTLLPPTSMSMSDEDCKMFGFHLQQLPHLRILRVDRPDEYWLPLDNRFIDPESRLLSSIVRKCSVLRYIKVGQFAWRVDRGMQGRVAILQAMDPTEQQDIELFQSGAEQDEYVQYNPLRCPVWAPTPHLAPTGLDGEFEETLEYEPLVGIALEKLSEWCTEQAQTLIQHLNAVTICWAGSGWTRSCKRRLHKKLPMQRVSTASGSCGSRPLMSLRCMCPVLRSGSTATTAEEERLLFSFAPSPRNASTSGGKTPTGSNNNSWKQRHWQYED